MKIWFRYENVPEMEVPEENLIGEYGAKTVSGVAPPAQVIAEGLSRPIGAPPLAEAVRGCRRVLILIDDITRLTPTDKIVPQIIEHLHAGGVKDRSISFLIAGGTHRPLKPEEKRKKLGEEIVDRYKITDHRWDRPRGLVDLGTLENGWPVVVDRHVPQADFVIGVGHIVPHRIFGYSGGVKIVLPGAAGKPSVNQMHWDAAQYPSSELFGLIENPIRRAGNEFAARAGLKYIVNAVQDDKEQLVAVVAGEPVAAYTAGVAISKGIYEVHVPREADIVVAEAYPADIDMWQSIKGYYTAQMVVRRGGVMMVISPLPEGISHAHPRVAKIGFHTLPEIQQMVWHKELEPGAAAAMLAYGGQAAKERATGMLVSPGVDEKETKRMGLIPAHTPQEGLEMAFSLVGKDAKVVVLHHGGEIFPRVAPPQAA